MKLTPRAINLISTQEVRLKLALALRFREHYITKLILKNKDNGPLTTAAALAVIRKETKLRDSEILEASEAMAA